jgi:3-deoxy-manno-octulosonate cytidylyltransferase (CMP-KDO synthetase)
MKVVGVIPARYQSSRFPGKPLVLIDRLPMVIRVAAQVEKALGRSNTYIATDDHRIASVCHDFGYQAVMTSPHCKTGTDRLAEFATVVHADVYINIQGDEPVIDPADIRKIADTKKTFFNKVINGMCNLLPHEAPGNPNIPKVVTAGNGTLLYMSRLPVPGIKDDAVGKPVYKKQVCIYAFNKAELDLYSTYADKPVCELYEDIEILRFLDAGTPVLMVETSGHSMAVDTPEDVALVEAFLQKNIARPI